MRICLNVILNHRLLTTRYHFPDTEQGSNNDLLHCNYLLNFFQFLSNLLLYYSRLTLYDIDVARQGYFLGRGIRLLLPRDYFTKRD
jgi:hypothetical protein